MTDLQETTASNSPSASDSTNGFSAPDTPDSDPHIEYSNQDEPLGHPTLTAFPSLTGLRPKTVTGTAASVSIASNLSFQDLQDAVQRIEASPAAAIQAAWAALLLVYTDAKEEVIFLTSPPDTKPNEPASPADKRKSQGNICRCSLEDIANEEASTVLRRLSEEHPTVSEPIDLEPKGKSQDVNHQNITRLVLSDLIKPFNSSASHGILRTNAGDFNYGVCVEISVVPTGLLGFSISFTDATMAKDAARLILKQFDSTIQFIISNPCQPISHASSKLNASLLSISNPRPETLEPVCSFQGQFEDFARSHSNRVALDFRRDLQTEQSLRNTRWTYAQLDQKAQAFAKYLNHHYGWLANRVVPICMDRCPEIYLAILGVLKAGGGWCPIDPAFPPKRRHDLIVRTDAQMVLTTTGSLDGMPKGMHIVNVTTAKMEDVSILEHPPTKPDDLAYLIWTSGTTGEPKGVPIHVEAAVTAMEALQKTVPTDTRNGAVRCLQFSQFTFDVFVQDLFYTWGVGGTLISSDRATMLGSFAELATKTGATHAHLTPAFAASVPSDKCPTLEVITMIGEKLTQNVADDWGHNMRAYNTYGPAETTVVSTLRQFGGSEDSIQSANVGLPLPSVTVVVIRDGKPVMTNGIGELALGGPQVSKGYWKDPAKTAERFVWSEELEMTLYLTGDIVRLLHNHTLEFVGRTDDLVKIQGIRVELSEIAFSLRSCHSLVQQVEVQYIDRPDRPSKLIIAFLAVPELGKLSADLITNDTAVEITQSAQRDAKTNLPGYMIPHVFLVLGSIPRTPSNKIDRVALKTMYATADLGALEMKLAARPGDTSTSKDWSEQEAKIIRTISEISGTSMASMSRASTLPSIGIDSISATRLITILNTGGSDMSIAELLACQNLAEFLGLAQRQPSNSTAGNFDSKAFNEQWLECIRNEVSANVTFVAPALPLQESLVSESIRNADMYWSNNLFSLNRDVDLQRLRSSWENLAATTDALRCAFLPVATLPESPDTSATFLQVILDDATVDWNEQTADEDEIQDRARHFSKEIVERHRKRSFATPPWAITIFTTDSQRAMLVSIHHAIRDELSMKFIFEDLHRFYADPNNVEAPYGRYQLREALSLLLPKDDQHEQDTEYWSRTLRDFSEQQDTRALPGLVNGKAISGFMTHTWEMRHSYQYMQSEALNAGASSVAALLRITWGLILLEYLGSDEVVFGETWSARSEAAALSDVVGPLITVIPILFRRHGSAREILEDQAKLQKAARSHFGVHPRAVRQILKVSETDPLYPAVYNFIPDIPSDQRDKTSSLFQRTDSPINLSVEHPLAFNASLTSDGKLSLELVASRQVFDEAHLAILGEEVEALTYSILEYPDEPSKDLISHLSPNLLSISVGDGVNAPNPAFETDPQHWVAHYASTNPNWSAAEVVSNLQEQGPDSDKWTYKELQQAYRHIANTIRNQGIFGKMIAVCLERRLDVYAVILGILDSGNTYLPVAEDLPEERKSFLLQDSDAAMLFTSRFLASNCRDVPNSCQIVHVDELDYTKKGSLKEGLYAVKPTDNAYLLYTSGSTGVPKGVLVSRSNLTSFTEADAKFIGAHMKDMQQLHGKGKYLGLASYAFDVHLKEMFTAWRHGMTAVTAPRSLLLDNLELALRELKVTHASFVPSLIDSVGLQPSNAPELRYLTVGGEKISKRVIDTWAGKPGVTLVNAYGPTEVTIGCCFQKVELGMNVRNIGPPLSYTAAHVLHPKSLEYTLRGTAGELCLTGDLVANGYYKRPDAKGFVEDFHGKRMYRTGDMVCLMADGTLEFLGRDDDQTKVRGQRLELGEVTEALRAAAASTLKVDTVDAAAIVAEHPAIAKPQLIVFLASCQTLNGEEPHFASSPDSAALAEIRTMCLKTLPAFMVPDHIVPLTRLPVASVSRKVDAKRLKALFAEVRIEDLLSGSSSVGANDRPLNETEELVAKAVTDTLSTKEATIKPSTNLFQLGLDSLSVISLTIRLQKLGFDCNVTDVLSKPVVEQLALLHQKGESGKSSEIAHKELADLQARFIEQHGRGDDENPIVAVRPCLPLQETMIASSLARPDEALYVNHVILRIAKDVDLVKLIKAWRDTIAELEITRTCFREFENHYVQVVLKAQDLSWSYIGSHEAEIQVIALKEQQSETASAMISNISSVPPIRLTLASAKEADTEATMMVSIHHALYDGEAFPMIVDEVYGRYRNQKPQPRTPFSQLVAHIWSQDKDKAQSFWQRYLRDYRPVSFQVSSDNERTVEVEKANVTSLSQIERFASSLNGTPASLMQAVFGIVLAQHLNRRDVVFGTIYSGRTVSIDSPHTIAAPCITTIPQRVTTQHSHSSLTNTITAAQSGSVESLEYQHTALRDIHRWVKAERPLFDTLFSYAHRQKSAPWSSFWWEIGGSMPSEFPFALEIEADRDASIMLMRCIHKSAAGETETANSFLENMDLLLGALVRGESVKVKDLAISDTDVEDAEEYDEDSWSNEEALMKGTVAEITSLPPNTVMKGVSFFSLGIDSISAIKFAQRLRAKGLECSSADIMRFPCIVQLARHVTTSTAEADSDGQGPVDSKDVQLEADLGSTNNVLTTYPCTPLQSSMLTSTLSSDGTMYVHHHVRRLPPNVDLERLRNAWIDLTASTEILRTTFHYSDSTRSWTALVHKEHYIKWAIVDSRKDLNSTLEKLRSEFCFRETRDYESTLWKVAIFDDVMILSMHHALYDGKSLAIMLHDLEQQYQKGKVPVRPPFSEAAKEIAKDAGQAGAFWLQNIDDFQGLEGFKSATVTREAQQVLNVDVSKILEQCKQLGVTLQSVALLAFGKCLVSTLKRRDLVFGHVVGGRTLSMPSVNDVIGPLFNTVPFRFTLDKAYATNKAVAVQIQDFTGQSQAHQHASLSKVQQGWRKKNGDADAELFNAIFLFQKPTTSDGPGLLSPIEMDGGVNHAEYPINFEIEQRENEVSVLLASSLIEDLPAWLDRYEQALYDILRHPSRSVMGFPEELSRLPLLQKQKVGVSEEGRVHIFFGLEVDCVRRVLGKVSGIPAAKIAEDTTIFSMGLDSISAIQVAATCREEGIGVSVADVLQGRSVGGICKLVGERKGQTNQVANARTGEVDEHKDFVSEKSKAEALEIAGLSSEHVEDVLPCLAGQLYNLANWVSSGRTMREGIFAYSCKEKLQADKLRSAWYELRKRHQVLRTVFVAPSPNETVQLVMKAEYLHDNSFGWLETSDGSEELVTKMIKQETNDVFDLYTPPVRLVLVWNGRQSHVLLRLHHAIYDAWTVSTLVDELAALYKGQQLPSAPNVKPFIRSTQHALEEPQNREYWRKGLQNCQPTLIKSSSLQPDKAGSPFFFTKHTIPQLSKLETLCKATSTSLPTLLLISFARALAKRTGAVNPTFGLFQTGRSADVPGLKTLSFPCLNVLPLTVKDAISRGTREIVEAVQNDSSDRVRFEQAYLRDILSDLELKEKVLFNSWVNILWHDTTPASTTTTNASSGDGEEWKPWHPQDRNMESLLPTERQKGNTAVDRLDTSFLAEENLFLDVARNGEGDCIDMLVRCDSTIMSENEARGLLQEVGEGLQAAVEEIGDDAGA